MVRIGRPKLNSRPEDRQHCIRLDETAENLLQKAGSGFNLSGFVSESIKKRFLGSKEAYWKQRIKELRVKSAEFYKVFKLELDYAKEQLEKEKGLSAPRKK